jgi:hypothetical protein
MSLRAAASGFWRRSNLYIAQEIASGKEQERPRNDMVLMRARELVFLQTIKGFISFVTFVVKNYGSNL